MTCPFVVDLSRREPGYDENGRTGEAIFDERERRASCPLDPLRPLALAKTLMSNANPAAVIVNARLWWWRGGTLAERWRD